MAYRSLLVASLLGMIAALACSSEDATPQGAGATGGSAGAATQGGSDSAGGTSNAGGSATTGGSSAGGSAGSAGGGAGGGGDPGGGGVVPGTAGYNCDPPSGTVPALQATKIVGSGLSQPILVAHEPNGAPDRLFVLERTGTIRIIENGALLAAPFLDFSSKVGVGTQGGDERGALGLAFHPDYETNGLFYVHYNDVASTYGDSVFEEYKVSTDKNVADPSSGRVVLKVTQPDNGNPLFKNHKGGAINFGADGFLYIGLGDGGGSNDMHGQTSGNGQNVSVLLGKILRIDPVKSGESPYSVPAGNLKDTMPNAAPEIWDYGLRNPFRFTFDGCTGDLYIGDVGQDTLEEINVEEAGEGGKNYGWNVREGKSCRGGGSNCANTGFTDPVLDYPRSDGRSVTGGAVYRGSAIPALRGTYIYADYQDNKIWSTVYHRDTGMASAPVSLTQDLNNVSKVVSITNGADGEIYFVSIEQGAVYKLEAAE
jgi:glucose/arabinose dehydrogenase